MIISLIYNMLYLTLTLGTYLYQALLSFQKNNWHRQHCQIRTALLSGIITFGKFIVIFFKDY